MKVWAYLGSYESALDEPIYHYLYIALLWKTENKLMGLYFSKGIFGGLRLVWNEGLTNWIKQLAT